MKTTATIGAWLLCLIITVQTHAETSPTSTLDAFYKAGAGANYSAFIAQLTDDAVLLGVDAGSRLQGETMHDYVSESFANGKNWAYHSSDREIRLSADGSVAWFDESLQHEQLGIGRASGVLIAKSGNWKIAQYNLTLPLSGTVLVSPTGTSGAAANAAAPSAPQKPKCRQLRHKTNTNSNC